MREADGGLVTGRHCTRNTAVSQSAIRREHAKLGGCGIDSVHLSQAAVSPDSAADSTSRQTPQLYRSVNVKAVVCDTKMLAISAVNPQRVVIATQPPRVQARLHFRHQKTRHMSGSSL